MKKKIIGFFGTACSILLIAIVLMPNSEAGAKATSENFQMKGTTLVSYYGTEKEVTIPSDVEVIGRSAFENNAALESVILPDHVKSIEPYAFWGCPNLKSVTLGNGLYEVGDFTFTDCAQLETVTLSASIRRIGIMAFADCPSLERISIASSVTDIHETAFDGDKYLTIDAPSGSYAYAYGLALTERQEEMGEPAAPTPSPTATAVPQPTPDPAPAPLSGEVLGQSYVVGNKAFIFIEDAVLNGDTVQETLGETEDEAAIDRNIAQWSHYADSELTEFSFADGTEAIGQFAFARSALTEIILPEGVRTIDYAAFYHCDALEQVQIPATVTAIGAKAFSNTPWLEGFYAGENPQDGDFLIVGDGVLIAYRGNAKVVKIPKTVKYIAEEAFLNHTEILNVVYPEDAEIEIAASAFLGCANLSSDKITY